MRNTPFVLRHGCRAAVPTVVGAAVFAAVLGSCARPRSIVDSEVKSSSVEFALTLTNTAQIVAVDYQISGNDIAPISGTIPLAGETVHTARASVAGIPAGMGYLLRLTAVSTDGKTTCAGDTQFDAEDGKLANANVVLQCRVSRPPSTGGTSGGAAAGGGAGGGFAGVGGAGGVASSGTVNVAPPEAGQSTTPMTCSGDPTVNESAACDRCTSENCVAATDSCDHLNSDVRKASCRKLYCCLRSTHCSENGDLSRCWCGSALNSTGGPSDDCRTMPGKASGPCLHEIEDAAESTLPADIRARFVDPEYAIGAAMNLASCRLNFCRPPSVETCDL